MPYRNVQRMGPAVVRSRRSVGPKRIYFAGKVDSYRSQLFTCEAPMYQPVGTSLQLINGAVVIYGGPSSLNEGGHGWITAQGDVFIPGLPHQLVTCYGTVSGEDPTHWDPSDLADDAGCNHNGSWGGLTAEAAVARCLGQIDKADAVHAYINTLDCFGTLIELGYAAAKGIPIYLVIDRELKEKLAPDHEYEVDEDGNESVWEYREGVVRSDLWFVEHLPTVAAIDYAGPTFISEQLAPPPPKRLPIPTTVQVAILERDGYRCRMCGASPADGVTTLEIDHIHPCSKGGSNEPSNLQTLCRPCNNGKRDRLMAPTPLSTGVSR